MIRSFFLRIEGNHRASRIMSVVSLALSVLALLIIAFKWSAVTRIHPSNMTVLTTQADVERSHQSRSAIEFQHTRAPYFVKTGFYIHSLAFVNSSDVNITGYLWQKFPLDFPADRIGPIFPDAVNNSSNGLEKAYEQKGEEIGVAHDMIGWRFDVTIRQTFDYSKYPLDYPTVWLRLWSQEFSPRERGIVLEPDFEAYGDHTRSVFGLDNQIVRGQWKIDETFFSYNEMTYDTDFGFSSNNTNSTWREFYFNLGLTRKFIDAFVINLVTLMLVALLVYAQVMTVSRQADLAERFGFNAATVLAGCSSLLFIIVLSHVQIRKQFADSGLVYIEYWYLALYFMIFLSALNTYFFTSGRLRKDSLLLWNDNLIAKLLFWPLLLGILALISLIKL